MNVPTFKVRVYFLRLILTCIFCFKSLTGQNILKNLTKIYIRPSSIFRVSGILQLFRSPKYSPSKRGEVLWEDWTIRSFNSKETKALPAGSFLFPVVDFPFPLGRTEVVQLPTQESHRKTFAHCPQTFLAFYTFSVYIKPLAGPKSDFKIKITIRKKQNQETIFIVFLKSFCVIHKDTKHFLCCNTSYWLEHIFHRKIKLVLLLLFH